MPVLVLGIVYMLFARRWLPAAADDAKGAASARPSLADWIEEYKLAGREHRFACTRTVAARRQDPRGIASARHVRGEHRRHRTRTGELIQPTAKTELRAGDILLVDLFAPDADVEALHRQYALEAMPLTGAYFTDRSQEIGMAEVILPANSELVGKTVVAGQVPRPLRPDGDRPAARRGRARARPANEELKIGDTLLVIGPWKAISQCAVRRQGPGRSQPAGRTRRSAAGRRQGDCTRSSAWRSWSC